MILFLDYETSDLIDWKARAREAHQPHIQAAAWETTDDEGKTIETFNQIIKPDGWRSTPGAEETHGITYERAMAEGVDEKETALKIYDQFLKADAIVAHNLKFDKMMTRIAGRRFGFFTDDDDDRWHKLPQFCTMMNMNKICGLKQAGSNRPKFPTLEEAYEKIFKTKLPQEAHQALPDMLATKRLYFWLVSKGFKAKVPEPRA